MGKRNRGAVLWGTIQSAIDGILDRIFKSIRDAAGGVSPRFEGLESRLLFDNAPIVSAIVIPSAAINVPLTLSATAIPKDGAGDPISYQWSVSNSSPSFTATTVPSYTTTPTAAGTWTAILIATETATATTYSTSVTQSFVVASSPSLKINGPGFDVAGATAKFTLTGGTASWTATSGTNTFTAIGSSSFDFTPIAAGNYTVLAQNTSGSATAGIVVTDSPPAVTISGPSLAFAGKSQVFSSTVTQATGLSSPLTYTWKLINTNAGVTLGFTNNYTSSSLVVPGNDLSAGALPYEICLTVTGSISPVTESMTFTVLANPNSSDPEQNYQWGAVPWKPDYMYQTGTTGYTVVAQQPSDGKIVIAGVLGDPDQGFTSSDISFSQAFIARLNPNTVQRMITMASTNDLSG